MFDVNRASVAKLGWHIISKKDCLWVKPVSAKYLVNQHLLEVESTTNSTWFWKGILRTRDILVKGLCWAIKEDKVNIWCDPWVPIMPNFLPLIKRRALLPKA